MLEFILYVSYASLLTASYLLFKKIVELLESDFQNENLSPEIKEALQLIISGLLIVVLTFSLTWLVYALVFSSLLGTVVIFSGLNPISKIQDHSSIKNKMKGMNLLLTILLVSQCIMAFKPFIISDSDKDERISKISTTNVKKDEEKKASGIKYLKKSGNARQGSSTDHEILGVCPRGSEVKLLKKKNEFYFVKGSYIKGTKKNKGKFWIWGRLLSENKVPPKKKKKKWLFFD